MYREPVPVIATALATELSDLFLGQADVDEYFFGDRAKYLKYQNIIWFALLSIGTFWACHLLTSSATLSYVAMLLINIRLPLTSSGRNALGLDSLDTEAIAAATLILGSVLLVAAVRRDSLRLAAASGLLFGVLVLTKAAMFYVSAGLFFTLLCLLAVPRRLMPQRPSAAQVLVLTVTCVLVVLPWIYRNYTHFGSFQIADRGGGVLYVRAIKNSMTREEYIGSFYVWAPGLRRFVGLALGFSEADLQKGGRLQRLNRAESSDFAEQDRAAELAGNPDAAISFYRKARAERQRLHNELSATPGDITTEADRILQQQAIALIRNHLGNHLAMTIPFLWRGAATVAAVLLICFTYAVSRRNIELAIFVLPSIGLVLFYGLFNHFIPRYSTPAVPVAIVAGLVLTKALWDLGKMKFRSRPPR